MGHRPPTAEMTARRGWHPATRRQKVWVFVLEGINSSATTYYGFYLYFFLQQRFGFSNKLNLMCAALSGGIYVLASWQGGRFAQKHGHAQALTVGFSSMAAALLAGSVLQTPTWHLVVLGLWTIGMSFTWPPLEAMASENESRRGVQQMVGIYNLVWAGTSAIAYFTGGAMLEKLGARSIFLLPAGLHLVQLGMLFWLGRSAGEPNGPVLTKPERPTEDPHPHPVNVAKAFLGMAWLANPFAYVAINSLLPTMPYVAQKLELSPMFAGFFCSIWLFARLAAFAGLWLWDGWPYKLRWLVSAFIAMIASFVALLLAQHLWLLIGVQVVFGLAIGLIYYSSLYYSMDVGETKGEHGGLHEAAIGMGNCAGPAIGAAALHLFPASAQSGTWGVAGLLVLGFGALLAVGWRSKRRA